jgi:hypothetical protein
MHDNKDCYLMSVVVYNNVTNKGVPVAFFVNSIESGSTISKWLEWLKSTFNLNVNKIMIDCSATEQMAIRHVFGNSVQILLCHWHIREAWDGHIRNVTASISYVSCINTNYYSLIILKSNTVENL